MGFPEERSSLKPLREKQELAGGGGLEMARRTDATGGGTQSQRRSAGASEGTEGVEWSPSSKNRVSGSPERRRSLSREVMELLCCVLDLRPQHLAPAAWRGQGPQPAVQMPAAFL